MEGFKDFKDMEDFKLRVMGVNVFPMVKAGLKWQSEQKRRESTISMSAPDPDNPILDLYDCKGENPYTIEEILPDKVWRVLASALTGGGCEAYTIYLQTN